MVERPAPTPPVLREQAQRATRLADGITDEQARTILLDFAEELLERAAQLEAGPEAIEEDFDFPSPTGIAFP
jgi:hypothetical protein